MVTELTAHDRIWWEIPLLWREKTGAHREKTAVSQNWTALTATAPSIDIIFLCVRRSVELGYCWITSVDNHVGLTNCKSS